MKEDHPLYHHLKSLPGMTIEENRVFCYVQSTNLKSFHSFFPKITTFGPSLDLPRSGGLIAENTIVITPDGRQFFGLSYKGDVERWGQKLRAGCAELGLLWAEVQTSNLLLSSGEVINLSDCRIQKY